MTDLAIPLGSLEYVSATVTADVTLDGSVGVEIAVTPIGSSSHTWLPAGWAGSASTSRSAKTSSPVTFDTTGSFIVYVQLTDTPEVPIVIAGVITVS